MLALDPRVFEPVWQTAKSLLPVVVDEHPLGCHRPRVDARRCFFGIVARLVTGASWDTVGRLVGVSESTLLRRRTEWQRAGVFTQLAELALSAYDTMIGLRLDEISIDGSVHKAPMGGEGTGPSPVDRGKRGWKWSMASDGSGVPIAWVPGAANTPDTRLLDDTLDVLDARGFEIEIEQAHLDRGYDAVAVRDGFAESGIDAHIVHRAKHVRGRKYGSRARNKVPLGRRWKVERANSWLSNFGQLRRNTDRKPIQREAAMDLAVTFVITVKLIKWRQRYGNTIHHPHQLTY
jgi:transposase